MYYPRIHLPLASLKEPSPEPHEETTPDPRATVMVYICERPLPDQEGAQLQLHGQVPIKSKSGTGTRRSSVPTQSTCARRSGPRFRLAGLPDNGPNARARALAAAMGCLLS